MSRSSEFARFAESPGLAKAYERVQHALDDVIGLLCNDGSALAELKAANAAADAKTIQNPAAVWAQVHAEPTKSGDFINSMKRSSLMLDLERSDKPLRVTPELVNLHLDHMVSEAKRSADAETFRAANGVSHHVRTWMDAPITWNGTENSMYGLWQSLRMKAEPDRGQYLATTIDYAKLNAETRAFDSAARVVQRLALGDRY